MLVARKVREDKEEVEIVALGLNTESNIKVAKPPTFNRVSGFIIACRLYLRMRMRKI